MFEICEIIYDDRSDLFEHCESHQKEDDTFVCNYEGCTYRKKLLSGVFFHAQNNHHGVKYFKCEQCKKPFTFLCSLVSHTNSHNRASKASRGNHICSMCKVYFNSLPRIRAHFEKQHDNTCNNCKTVYSKAGNLLKYLIREENVCQKRKKLNQEYTNETYSCNQC